MDYGSLVSNGVTTQIAVMEKRNFSAASSAACIDLTGFSSLRCLILPKFRWNFTMLKTNLVDDCIFSRVT